MPAITSQTPIRVQNILFATDFSTPSETALPHALSLARQYDAHLIVAHVIRPDLFELVGQDESQALKQSARRHAEEQMTRLLISGRLRGVPHEIVIEEGPLWNVLAGKIEAHNIDLVVVGTHGRTGSRKLLLGSAAEEVFRLAPCPVLTVGPRVAAGKGPLDSPRHVLFATNLSRDSARAAAFAFSLAQEHQAHLSLLHVVKDAVETSSKNHTMLKEFVLRRLKELMPPEAELWCDPEFLVEFGSPTEAILQVAEQKDADLIVLGIHRSAAFAGHLPPATAYKVVCQARCPVLTVRG